ncbi:MAG TPA: CARDB domain-containing protein [Gemmatimonadales bacterium]|nr:CARDB domain-containing protein [Gemmatimonadales bacterium]
MRRPFGFTRLHSTAVLAFVLSACFDQPGESPTGPEPPTDGSAWANLPGLTAALQAHERHTARLLATPGVVGTAVGIDRAGKAIVKVFAEQPGIAGLPASLDQVAVAVEVTGRIYARTDPTTRLRPAPIGFSVGHPAITAGTIGAKVLDQAGNAYILSNNHVLANANSAQLGDAALQPGTIDGGVDPADRLGTLSAFEPLQLALGGYGVTPPSNWIDAAIALVPVPSDLSNSTPLDGYGVPNTAIYGDADANRTIDNIGSAIGLGVQKYGRTTMLTQGQVSEVNVTIDVCYDIFCLFVGRFYDQIGICCAAFSGGGDSGSLIVTTGAGKNPVGLLFAGGGNRTFANRIDRVLNRFGVSIDGGASPPPQVTDIAVSGISAPASATQGTQVAVGVLVENAGNQTVGGPIVVTLADNGVTVGTQTIPAGFAAGASTTLGFTWNTTDQSLGSHTLQATQSFADDNAGNDSRTTSVTLEAPPSGDGSMHVGDLDGNRTSQGRTWTAIVTVLVHDALHAPVTGVTVTGTFSSGANGSRSCTTGSTGSCTIAKGKLRSGSITFTVGNATGSGLTYASAANHDIDFGTNGTTITVARP